MTRMAANQGSKSQLDDSRPFAPLAGKSPSFPFYLTRGAALLVVGLGGLGDFRCPPVCWDCMEN